MSPLYDWIAYLPRWQEARRRSEPRRSRSQLATVARLIAATIATMQELRP